MAISPENDRAWLEVEDMGVSLAPHNNQATFIVSQTLGLLQSLDKKINLLWSIVLAINCTNGGR